MSVNVPDSEVQWGQSLLMVFFLQSTRNSHHILNLWDMGSLLWMKSLTYIYLCHWSAIWCLTIRGCAITTLDYTKLLSKSSFYLFLAMVWPVVNLNQIVISCHGFRVKVILIIKIWSPWNIKYHVQISRRLFKRQNWINLLLNVSEILLLLTWNTVSVWKFQLVDMIKCDILNVTRKHWNGYVISSYLSWFWPFFS